MKEFAFKVINNNSIDLGLFEIAFPRNIFLIHLFWQKDSLKESYAAVYNQLSALKTKYSDISSMSENSVQQT